MQRRSLPNGWDRRTEWEPHPPLFPADSKGLAGRDASADVVLNALAAVVCHGSSEVRRLAPFNEDSALTSEEAGGLIFTPYQRTMGKETCISGYENTPWRRLWPTNGPSRSQRCERSGPGS